jgi:hypothetical protein
LSRITPGSASISPTRKTCCAFAEPTAAKIVAAKNDMSFESLIMIAAPLHVAPALEIASKPIEKILHPVIEMPASETGSGDES